MSDFARLMEIAIANDPEAAAAAMGTPVLTPEEEKAAAAAQHDTLARYASAPGVTGATGPATGATGHVAAPEHKAEAEHDAAPRNAHRDARRP